MIWFWTPPFAKGGTTTEQRLSRRSRTAVTPMVGIGAQILQKNGVTVNHLDSPLPVPHPDTSMIC